MGVRKNIAYLPGDGIGPEVLGEGMKILDAIARKYNHEFIITKGLIGGVAIDETGSPLPERTIQICQESDAILLGAVGMPKFDLDPNSSIRPEQGLLALRKALDLYINIRPVTVFSSMVNSSVLKPEIAKGVDLVIFRELSSGIYFGEKMEANQESGYASDLCEYNHEEISRVSHAAFKRALKRRKRLCLVDKANVMATSRLWRRSVMEIAQHYPEVELDFMYVDNAAMQIILNPSQFDVILTSNMFGDILSDLSSILAGSLGLLPSSSIGAKNALFEPVHGSYPQAAGKDIANPLASILSVKMMFEYFGLFDEADTIFGAVKNVLSKGYGTVDMAPEKVLPSSKLTRLITSSIVLEKQYHQI